ncbi:MAG: Rho-binding antiterminator [Pseudomonadota bacterium]|uniref:Rho-binding antiterminator n=1 Tax=Thermithiobacillus tepidarius TaxID=929 RepID=UPI00041F190C|nr:Rho-binding antiterminator [Thermithiobacillus tepidarius]
MNPPYEPVSCVFHEQLEMAARRRRPVGLRLKSGETLHGVIEDVWTEAGAEYLRLADQQGRASTWRLDALDALWEDDDRGA